MAFLGKIGELFDIVSETAQELKEIATDSGREFKELATEGFVEMVIKGKTTYKTSYEIEAEANQTIRSANVRYKESVDLLKGEIDVTENKLVEFGQQKVDVQTNTIAVWLGMVNRFQAINYTEKQYRVDKLPEGFKKEGFQQISTRVIEVEKNFINPTGLMDFSKMASFGAGLLKLSGTAFVITSPAAALMLVHSFLPRNQNFFEFYGQRSSSAKKYLAEAKLYANDVELEVSKMEVQKATLQLMQTNVNKGILCLELLRGYLTELMKRIEEITVRYEEAERKYSSGYRKYFRFLGKRFPSFDNRLFPDEENIIVTSIYTVFAINNLSEASFLNDEGYPNEAVGEMIRSIEQFIAITKGVKEYE